MEYLFEYIKRNTKYAAKNVFLKFREYVPFFAAIFIIECVFFTVFITTASNNKNISDELTSRFDYDVVISGLSENENRAVSGALFLPSFKKDRSFENYWSEQAPLSEGGDYRIYVNMRDDNDYKKFIDYYVNPIVGGSEDVSVAISPLYEYKLSSNMMSESPPLLLIIAMCLISVLAIAALYSVRLNNQKFMYGIYITFGANLKRLISTAVFEMMLIGVIMFVPSALLSYLFALLAYKAYGVSIVFGGKMVIKVLVSILLVSIAGVYLPMKVVSRKTPISLITASDNSNHVVSPRASVNLLGRKYPKHYEFLSVWRFRKYFVKLILSSVIFTSVFICGFYISDMYDMNLSSDIEEYTVVNRSTLSADEQLDDLDFIYTRMNEIDGVSGVVWNVDAPASELSSIALISKDSEYRSGGITTTTANAECLSEEMRYIYDRYHRDGYSTVTNSLNYTCLDKNMLDYLENKYDIEGDVYSVMNDKNTVIVSENVYNERRFKFNVGDKIIVGKKTETLNGFDGDYFDTVGVLNYLVQENCFEFTEYTIGAVIKDYPDSDGTFMLGMSEGDYSYLTERSTIPSSATIYLDSDTSFEEAEVIDNEISTVFRHLGNDYVLNRSYETVNRNILIEKNHAVFALLLSSLVLIMSPVIWFFSQSAFIGKRKKELHVLRTFGAVESRISKMFSCSGTVMAALGFVVATVMSIPASYLVYMTLNTWLPSLGFAQSNVMYKFYVAPIALIVCAIVTAASGYLASMLPYKMGIKAQKKTEIKNEYGGNEK